MENYTKIKEAKSKNNEYVPLRTSVQASKLRNYAKPMMSSLISKWNLWAWRNTTIGGQFTVSNDRCEIVTKKSDIP